MTTKDGGEFICGQCTQLPRENSSYPALKLDQVDSWIDFCAHEIELPATIWCYPVIGYMPYNDAAVSKAKEDLRIALGALEKALLERTYLVRNRYPC